MRVVKVAFLPWSLHGEGEKKGRAFCIKNSQYAQWLLYINVGSASLRSHLDGFLHVAGLMSIILIHLFFKIPGIFESCLLRKE